MATTPGPLPGKPTGLDLRLERVRAGLTQTELARRMGVRRPHVTMIERLLRPTPRSVARYMAALAEEAEE